MSEQERASPTTDPGKLTLGQLILGLTLPQIVAVLGTLAGLATVGFIAGREWANVERKLQCQQVADENRTLRTEISELKEKPDADAGRIALEQEEEDKRKKQRSQRSTARLPDVQNGWPLRSVPNGTYGFADPEQLEAAFKTNNLESVALHSERDGTATLEIQKYTDGRIGLMGFASEDVKALFETDRPSNEAVDATATRKQLLTYESLWECAKRTVSVPFDRIDQLEIYPPSKPSSKGGHRLQFVAIRRD